MERLTERTPFGFAVPVKFPHDFVQDMQENHLNAYMDMVNRLAAYEDTGYTPEELRAILAPNAEG